MAGDARGLGACCENACADAGFGSSGRPRGGLCSVLLVAHLLQPIDGFAVEVFLDGAMGHGGGWGGTVPVFLARRKPDDVARADLLNGSAIALHPAAARRHEQRLAEGIGALPNSLHEAIETMERSELLPEVLGEHVFEWFIRNKRAEWSDYKAEITAFELRRYLTSL